MLKIETPYGPLGLTISPGQLDNLSQRGEKEILFLNLLFPFSLCSPLFAEQQSKKEMITGGLKGL